MKFEDLTTIDQLTDLLSGTYAVAFSVLCDKDAYYRWFHGELGKLLPDEDLRLLPFAVHPADCPIPQNKPYPVLNKSTPSRIQTCWRRWMNATK